MLKLQFGPGAEITMSAKKFHTPWWLSGGLGLVIGGWFEISTLQKRHSLQEIFTTSLIWDVIVVAAFVTGGFIVLHEILDKGRNDRTSRSK